MIQGFNTLLILYLIKLSRAFQACNLPLLRILYQRTNAAYFPAFDIFCVCGISLPTLAAQIPGFGPTPQPRRLPAPESVSCSTSKANRATSREPSFALFRWDRFPSVLVLDMADFAEQDRMFSRLAFYLEKPGYRGRLLSDAQLAGKHGWNAHDYGPEGLASFFDAAEAARFPLDGEELLLRGLALREGIIAMEGEVFRPGSGAVLSISRSSSKYERIFLLAHESYHGIFFCSEEYRELCGRLWKAAPLSARLFMTRLLAALDYDPSSPCSRRERVPGLPSPTAEIRGLCLFRTGGQARRERVGGPDGGRGLALPPQGRGRPGGFPEGTLFGQGRGSHRESRGGRLMRLAARASMALLLALLSALDLHAHPHVFISSLVAVDFEGPSLSRISVEWTFDELFSQMISRGLR